MNASADGEERTSRCSCSPPATSVPFYESLLSGFFPRNLGRNIFCGAENSIGKISDFPTCWIWSLNLVLRGPGCYLRNSWAPHAIGRTFGPVHQVSVVGLTAQGHRSPRDVMGPTKGFLAPAHISRKRALPRFMSSQNLFLLLRRSRPLHVHQLHRLLGDVFGTNLEFLDQFPRRAGVAAPRGTGAARLSFVVIAG
jgi:hypothetical protein